MQSVHSSASFTLESNMAKRFQRIAPSLAGVDAAGVEAFLDRV
ncbi:MAG: hypothetical protein RJA02_1834, partial [Armatimonadota bacterium]